MIDVFTYLLLALGVSLLAAGVRMLWHMQAGPRPTTDEKIKQLRYSEALLTLNVYVAALAAHSVRNEYANKGESDEVLKAIALSRARMLCKRFAVAHDKCMAVVVINAVWLKAAGDRE